MVHRTREEYEVDDSHKDDLLLQKKEMCSHVVAALLHVLFPTTRIHDDDGKEEATGCVL